MGNRKEGFIFADDIVAVQEILVVGHLEKQIKKNQDI